MVPSIHHLAQGHGSRAGQMLAIKGALNSLFSLRAMSVHLLSPSLCNTCVPPRCLSHWWHPSPGPDGSFYPGGLEKPTSWSGSLQAHGHWPDRTGGGAEHTEEPGGTHQTHNSGWVLQQKEHKSLNTCQKPQMTRECYWIVLNDSI